MERHLQSCHAHRLLTLILVGRRILGGMRLSARLPVLTELRISARLPILTELRISARLRVLTELRLSARRHLAGPLLLIGLLLTAAGCSSGNDTQSNRHPDRCVLEFSYTIGDIDPRFHISRNEVHRAVEDALVLWAGAVDSLDVQFHDGIRASDQARNIIHLEYDERQQYSDRARRFQDNIASKSEFIGQMHAGYEQEQRELERRTEEHRRLRERLNERIARFNDWVESVNEAGGFRADQRERYEQEMQAIASMQEQERGMRGDLERSVTALNRRAERLNREVDFHDDMVRQFYREFGDEFRFNSALYRFKESRGTITVYHFHNRRELKVLLAHEIGHALGLGHVPDSRSIMYETIRDQMLGAEISLSREDIRAVQALCR